MGKYSILFACIILIITIASCKGDSEKINENVEVESTEVKSKSEIVKENIELHLASNLNDPSSYQFVELVLIDSVTYKDNIDRRISMFTRNIEQANRDIEREERYRDGDMSNLYREEAYNRAKKNLELYTNYIEGIREIENNLDESVNEIASFTYIVSFRATNAFGALVLNEHFVQTKGYPDYEVINMTNERGRLHSVPNGFPGYDELLNRYR